MTSLHYETREYAGQFIDAWRHVSEIGIFSPPSFVLLPVRLPHRKILTRPSRAGEGDTSRHYRRGSHWFTRANSPHSPLDWQAHVSIPEDGYYLTKPTCLGRSISAQACFPKSATKFEHSCETTPTLEYKRCARARIHHCDLAWFVAHRAPLHENCSQLVAQANAQRTRSANQIAVRTYGFELSNRVTHFNRADLPASECDHFPKLTGGNEFHCCRAKHRT